jgi:hypothetical protein
MNGVALIARFDGDPELLDGSFHTAARKYARTAGGPQPDTALVLRNKDGIAVVLVWPEGTSLQPFRTFLRATIDELRLPHPRVEHFRASALTWETIAGGAPADPEDPR